MDESNNPQWQSKEAHPNSFNLEQYSEGAERFRPLANLPNYDDFDTSSPQVEFTLEGMEQTGPRRPQEINMAISGDSEPDEAIRQAEQAQPSPLDPSPRFGDLGGRYLESSSLPGWKARRARDESAERWGGFTKERKREEELRYHEEGSLSPGQKSVEVDEQIRRELEDWESPKEVWRDFTEDVASHNATLKPLLPEPQKDLEATDQGKSECTQLRKKLSNAYHSKASFFGAHPIVVMRNAVDRILRPPVPDDKRRIEWTCRCGLRMFDDYQEITSGALEKLQSLLDYSGGREHARNDGRVSSGFRTFQDVKTFVTSMFSRFRNSAQREDDLPQHDFRGSTPENTMTDNSARWNETYVLLNLPYKQTASKIDHIEYWREACNDESFFKVLRRRYDICHYSRNSFLQSLRQVFTLRMISDIRFVKFEMFRGGLTQVHQLDDIPPVGMRHAYDYYPSPAEHIPPIGPNLLLHLYYYPEDADDFTLHVQRVPKKLHGRLEPCPLKGYALGWGLHLTEGVSKVRLSIMGLASSTLSLIFGIVWSVRTAGDVQGGFTIAAYLMMMFLAALGSIQGLLER
ncbi:MAG: hypothetical protein M1831_000623 [Alyxoria varia]|nr:MAG: hypothetical protein M1831_000623 [Alyxoria varia]